MLRLDTALRKDLSEEVAFQRSQRSEDMSPMKIWKKKVRGRGDTEGKGPGVRRSLGCSRNSRKPTLPE